MPRDLAELKRENNFANMDPLGEKDSDRKPQEEQHEEVCGKSDLEKAADSKSPKPKSPGMTADDENSMIDSIAETHGKTTKRDDLHPYTQTLTLNDVESCTTLEEKAFPPQERCTREKFRYRLSACPELSLGIFVSSEDPSLPTYETSAPVYSGAPKRKSVLLGHIVSTKTINRTVTDADMGMPSPSDPELPKKGHKEEGRTVCIHSLAVLPGYQKRGLGKTLMKGYMDRLKNQDVADRAALISHEHLVRYYEGFGFENKGQSVAQFGGGGWVDMVIELKEAHPEE